MKRGLLFGIVLALAGAAAAVFYERSARLPGLVYVEIALLIAVLALFLAYTVYAGTQIVKTRREPEFKLTVMVETLTVALLLASVWLVIYFMLRQHSGPAPGS